jgi:RNA polymerase sigma factor (sigma-70 family)
MCIRARAHAHLFSVPLEDLAHQAQGGSAEALDVLLVRVQEKIYALALKMLRSRDDAHDATQEILLRIATRLASFRGESALMTWAYRVAVNYLISARKWKMEQQQLFATISRKLEHEISEPDQWEDPTHQSLFLEEIQDACAKGMLLCLDQPHRMAYVLGEILDQNGQDAARMLEISAATFRKRLSRARADMLRYMRNHCGVTEERRM